MAGLVHGCNDPIVCNINMIDDLRPHVLVFDR